MMGIVGVLSLAARACLYRLQCSSHPEGGGYSAAGVKDYGNTKHSGRLPRSTRRVHTSIVFPHERLSPLLGSPLQYAL